MSPHPEKWIEHDGKGWAAAVVAAERARGVVGIGLAFSTESGRRKLTPIEMAGPNVDPASPGWVWTWRGVWPFRRRVCGDRAYRPIVRYRFFYDTPPGAQAQVEMLREIAAGRRQPAPEPVPVPGSDETVSDAAHGGRIPRGSNAGVRYLSCGRDAGFHPPGERDPHTRVANTSSAGAPGIGAGTTSLLTSPGADRVGGLFGGASGCRPPCVRGVGAVVTRSSGCTPKAARLAVEQRRCADEQCG